MPTRMEELESEFPGITEERLPVQRPLPPPTRWSDPARSAQEPAQASEDASLGVRTVQFAPDPTLDEDAKLGIRTPRFADDEEMRKFGDEQTVKDLEYLFKQAALKSGDDHSLVLEVARYTGAPTDLVESQLPAFKAQMEASKWDPQQFLHDNRRLVQDLINRPELASVYMRDEKISGLWKSIRGLWMLEDARNDIPDAFQQADKELGVEKFDWSRGLKDPEYFLEHKRKVEEANARANQIIGDKQKAREIKPKKVATKDVPGGSFTSYGDTWNRARLGSELNSLSTQKAIAKRLGHDTYEIDKKRVDIQNQLSITHNYDGSGVDQTVMDTLNVASSQYDTYKGMGTGAIIAGGTAALITLLGTKNKNAAWKVGKAFGKKGAAVGGFLTSWTQEFGNIYNELEQDPEVAKNPDLLDGASAVYATVAAAIEVSEELYVGFGSKFGGIKSAIQRGEGAAFMKMALKDKTFSRIFLEAGKKWGKGVAGESIEEGVQQLVQSLVEWGAKRQAGEDSPFPTEDALRQATEAIEQAARGTAGLGAPNMVRNLVMGSIRTSAAMRAADRIKPIVEFATSDSPTLKAAPEWVAKQIEEETAASGERVKSVYVDPKAFTQLFAQEHADADQAARELMGPEGPAKVKEALATGTKIEVPMVDYLTKWGPKTEISQALAQDTTTRSEYETENERKAKEEENKKIAEQMVKEEEAKAKKENPAEPFFKTMEESLKATQKYGDADVKDMVELWRRALSTLSKRNPFISPIELARQYVPQIAATVGVSPQDFLDQLNKNLTKPADATVANQDSMFKGAAFRDVNTGQIIETGPFHDLIELSNKLNLDGDALDAFIDTVDSKDFAWQRGFVDHEGKFYTRDEAAKKLGITGTVRSTDVFGQDPLTGKEDPKKDAVLARITSNDDLKKVIAGTLAGDFFLWNPESAPLQLEERGPVRLLPAQDEGPSELARKMYPGLYGISGPSQLEFMPGRPLETSPSDTAKRLYPHLYAPSMKNERAANDVSNTPAANDPNILEQGTFDPNAIPRGFVVKMRRGMQRLYNLIVTEHADRSTFLHESAHIFIDMLGDVAVMDKSSKQTKDDWQTVLDYLGVKDKSQIAREHEEKFAKTFEKYLHDGKAPSARLMAAFQRFKIWLKEVYKTTLGAYFSGVQVDPSIRGVFDRMFATDEEINHLASMSGLKPMFRSPAEAGMSPEQWQNYLQQQQMALSKTAQEAGRRAVKSALRYTEQWWKDELKKKVIEEQANFDKRPDARALRFIKTQELYDENGQKVPTQLGKMDSARVRELLGEDAAKKYRGFTQKDGADPDQVAEAFGYESAAEMFRKIETLPSREETAQVAAEERMKAEHKDIYDDRAKLKEMVERQFHNEESTVDTLLTEYTALKKKQQQGPGGAPVEAIKLASKQIVAKMSLRRLTTSAVMNAEQAAGDRAFAHAAKGQYNEALIAKQQQILNFFIYKQIMDMQDHKTAFKDLLTRLGKKQKRLDIGQGGKELIDAVDSVLERLGIKPPEKDPTVVARRLSLDLLEQRFYAELTNPAFDMDVVKQLLSQPPSDWRDITVDQMYHVSTMLKQINRIASASNKVLLGDRRMWITDVVQQIAGESTHVNEGQIASDTAMGSAYWAAQSGSAFQASMRDPAAILKKLGPTAYKFFWQRYMSSRNLEDKLAERILTFFDKQWRDLPPEMQNKRFDKIDTTGLPMSELVNIDPSMPRDRQWLWMVFLNMGNKSNLQRLLGGYGWNEAHLMNWIQGKLSSEEVKFLQGVWNLMDTHLWEHVADLYEQVNGVRPPKILASPFVLKTSDGKELTVKGGYFPAKYRSDLSNRGLQQDMSAVENVDRAFPGASVMKGFTMGRATNYKDVIDLNWHVFPNHVADVIHYLAFDQFVRDANRVFHTADTKDEQTGEIKRGMRTIMQRSLGENYRLQMENWLKVVATGRADSVPKHMGIWMKAIGGLRSRFVMSSIGYSFGVALGDLPTFLTAWTSGKVKAKYMAPALIYTLTHGPTSYEENRQLSGELTHRSEHFRRKLMNDIVGTTGLREVGTKRLPVVGKPLEVVREMAWWMMEWTDRLVSNFIFEAAKRQHLSEGMAEKDAYAAADAAIQELLPAHDIAEQPALLRDRRGVGALMAFYGYFSKLYNVNADIWAPVQDQWNQAEGAGGKAKAVAWPVTKAAGRTLATLFVTNVISELVSGRGPEEDEPWDEWITRKMLASPFLMIPLVGGLAEGGVNRLVSGKNRQVSIRGAPGLAALQRIWDGFDRASKSGKSDERIWAALDALMTAAKLPGGQARKTGLYITQLLDGNARPRNIGDVVGGTLYGKRKKEEPANPFTIFER